MSNLVQQASKQSRFAAIPGQAIPRSKFPLEVRRLHSFNAGDMVPVLYIPMLPGDDIRGTLGAVVRLLSPLQKPMMDNLYLDWFCIFGATRLLWNNFEKFQGAKENPDDSTSYRIPYFIGNDEGNQYTVGLGGVADGLSFPLGVVDPEDVKISCLLHRLYRLFWNQWVRDQVYQDSVTVDLGDGPDVFQSVDGLLKRGKRHDYFTSALDAPQMGAGVPIPWENDGLAPVYGDPDTIPLYVIGGSTEQLVVEAGTGHVISGLSPSGNENIYYADETAYSGTAPLYADLGIVTANLNTLRISVVLQQIKELDKRGGTRYVEILRTRWNVITSDERLQRIEYVAGGSQLIGSHNVVQTSQTTEASPQGNLTSYMKGGLAADFRYRAPEHGYLMFILNVRAPLTYQQQLSRHLTRADRFDFPEPLAMHLGEEPVYQYEMFYPPTGANAEYMEEVWGWQERFAVDRYTPSTVTGIFRSEAPQSLDNWHLALDYGNTPPVHDGTWIQDNPPIDRVIQLTSQPDFIASVGVMGSKISSMPVYGVPGLSRF